MHWVLPIEVYCAMNSVHCTYVLLYKSETPITVVLTEHWSVHLHKMISLGVSTEQWALHSAMQRANHPFKCAFTRGSDLHCILIQLRCFPRFSHMLPDWCSFKGAGGVTAIVFTPTQFWGVSMFLLASTCLGSPNVFACSSSSDRSYPCHNFKSVEVITL